MAMRLYPNLAAFFLGEGRIQGQVAQELGISKAHLSMIKWGLREPDLALALQITARCHVPLESLVKRRPTVKATLRKKARRRPELVSSRG